MPDSPPNNIAAFDSYLDQQLQDADFRERFQAADHALDVALQLASLRRLRRLSQEQVAAMLGTRQQNVSRLENPAYRRHSLSMLRRYAQVLGGDLVVTVVPKRPPTIAPV